MVDLDPSVARARISDALASGMPAGELYTAAVRPGLDAILAEGEDVQSRIGAGMAAVTLAELGTALPMGPASARGRSAVLWSGASAIADVDGAVAADFLRADGWNVERAAVNCSPDTVASTARAGGVELAVAVVTGREESLRLSATLNALRRLADPPVILLGDFTGRARELPGGLTTTVDAVVHDPQEMTQSATRRSAAPGHRRWGVRLERSPDTLLLAPTGCFDAASAGRLLDVALSRLGTFTRLALDLLDIADVDAAGLAHLSSWPGLLGPREVEVIVIAGRPLLERIGANGPPAGLSLVDELDA